MAAQPPNPPSNGYLPRVLDNLQKSVESVEGKVDRMADRVEAVASEQAQLRAEMNVRQARAYDMAMEMLPKLGLMRWDDKEAEALRSMVARELAGQIMARKREDDVKWWQTRFGKLIVVLTMIALVATIGSFTLATYNAFFGVSHPIIQRVIPTPSPTVGGRP